jgi:hypothetical protein
MQDVDKHFSDTMEQLEGLETAFTAKLDAKFQEVLARLPPPPTAHAPPPQPTRVAPTPTFLGRAQRILKPPAQTLAAGDATGAAAAAALLLLALQELQVLQRSVMQSWMIITGKMSTRESTRTTSQLISQLVVLGPTFAVHLLFRWYVMMTMLLN